VHLYQGSTSEFIGDATRNLVAGKLSDRFFEHFRYRPAPSEVAVWQNSLRAMAQALQLGDLTEQGILVELQLPLTSKRLDLPHHRDDVGRCAVEHDRRAQAVGGRAPLPDPRVRGGRLLRTDARSPPPVARGRRLQAASSRPPVAIVRDRPSRDWRRLRSSTALPGAASEGCDVVATPPARFLATVQA
jgi:hypothetical protein